MKKAGITYSLQKELKDTKNLLEETIYKKDALMKALWDMLNYANIFIVLLDSTMHIKLANWSLATKLGFETEKDIIGKCWLDYIKPAEKKYIKNIHKALISNDEKSNQYTEITNDIILKNNETLLVKWFNIPINGQYNLTFSIGIQRCVTFEETEDAIRAYYRDIIDQDKTMIESIRESLSNSQC